MADFTLRIKGGDSVVIANDNTTIGYATLDAEAGLLTYIFVNPAFRRQGFGRILVKAAERAASRVLVPADPITSLGRKFFGKAA